MQQFSAIDNKSVEKIIMKGTSKSCALDPAPTSLMKNPEVLKVIIDFIVKLINISWGMGTMPDSLKQSYIIPRLKKSDLDSCVFKNYRPVSNLPWLSKIMETAVAEQIKRHLTQNDLLDPLQSAYRAGHSTESAMLKIKTDIDIILDGGDAALLVLLDLSAAFDTIDHNILLERLEMNVRISGAALIWLKSYLENRWQRVVIHGSVSEPKKLNVGVPQGSVLGPLLFLIYVNPLRRVIDQYDLHRHSYADDIQLYTRLPTKADASADIKKMSDCVAEIGDWMLRNRLKMNHEKTESIVIGGSTKLRNTVMKIGDSEIHPSKHVKSLGAYLDADHTMETQIASTTKACYFHLRRIAKIRNYITRPVCEKIVCACVASRIDYHNALLSTATDYRVKRIQKIQNNAARLITRTSRRDHITPHLKVLHWLPVSARIRYKILNLIHSAMHDSSAPKYLEEMVNVQKPTRALRSSSRLHDVIVPEAKKKIGENSAFVVGAKLWNELDCILKDTESKNNFKKLLKTKLFISFYE